MPKASKSIRVMYKVDPERSNGYVLASAAGIDLVVQGKTEEEVRVQLADEIGLQLAAVRASGTLEHWLAQASTASEEGALALDVDVSRPS
jgi:hypothetical protein